MRRQHDLINHALVNQRLRCSAQQVLQQAFVKDVEAVGGGHLGAHTRPEILDQETDGMDKGNALGH
ncbi:hypothetical protein D3C81_1837020 [compost metagenome]